MAYDTAYDDSNIFAKMLRGEIPSHRIYEDDDVLVTMDIFPQSRGHTLVIPKVPSRNMLDADAVVLSRIMPTIQHVAQAVMKATSADGLRFAQYNEAPAGQSVFHLHFHLIPVYEGKPFGAHGQGRADDVELAAMAREIAALL